MGHKDYWNLYAVSAEAGYSKVLQENNIDLSATLGVAALDFEINTGNIGSKNLYGNASGEVEVLTAEAKGDVKWGRSGYGFSGKAIAAGASIQPKATISIFGIDISLTGEGYAGAFGAGLDVMYEYKNGKRKMNFGARVAALFGFGGSISVSW
ncbi:hypothetical protein SH1V18_03870 [Vallitalea longa]|uniref:Uncharacterized protein n=1 Tax=Vallitalea longa TaxID=2936439 RepID=A0A9W5Y795_9FIRM|nr:hypothetical protein [Vallitalea longa]GKX27907.1 hypothetical protein SH1V18_03870 [Vallitalea longa]